MTNYTTNPCIQKVEVPAWEHAAFVYDGDLYRAGFKRSWSGFIGTSVIIEKYDAAKAVFYKIAELAWSLALGCVLVDDGSIYVFGTTSTASAGNSIKRKQIDPATWDWTGSEINVYTAPSNVKIYNTSATKGPDKYILAYETNEGVPFSLRFLQSTDLENWSAIGALCHGNFYSACPTVRYADDGYYILAYMWNNAGTYETAIARTNNFSTIQTFQGNASYTAYQQLLSPDAQEGNNNSDIDFCEWDGKVYFTYLTGNQSSWARPNDAWYDGTLIDFYREWWPAA